MPRKKRVKDQPATGPAQIAGALDEVIQRAGLVTADQLPPVEPKPDSPPPPEKPSLPDTDPDMPVLKPLPNGRTGQAEAAVAEALLESQAPRGRDGLTHLERLKQKGFPPTPSGFVSRMGNYEAGIRLFQSLDKRTVAIQFSNDWKPSRDGANPENEQVKRRGFEYKVERGLWTRTDRETPEVNYRDAKAFVADLVRDRLAEPSSGVGRG